MKIKFLLLCCLIHIFFLNNLKAETYHWDNIFNLKWPSNFTGISKLDSINIMAFGTDNEKTERQIYKSTNGGLNWLKVFQDDSLFWSMTMNICYITKNFCIATCDSNYILKTTDDGDTWEQKQINMKYSINGLRYVSLLDSLNGILGSFHDIVYSNDGFKSYKLIKFPGYLFVADVKLISPTKIYGLAINPNIFFHYDVVTDTWEEFNFPDYIPKYDSPYNMYFSDSLNGFIVGSRESGIGQTSYDMIHKTTDGGKTWVEKLNAYNAPKFGLFYVDFCDRENGIAVGQFGKIYWTHDSGNTWVQDYQQAINNKQPPVMHVAMLSKYTALIANYTGDMWRSSLATDVEERDYLFHQCNFENGSLIITKNTQEKANIRLELYDLLGNLINQITKISNENTIKIDFNNLISLQGVYVYRVYLNDVIYCVGKYIR